MLKRELKMNFKTFAIWTSILLGIFLVVFLLYPSIVSDQNIEMLNEMIKIFPEEMLKAFNMDISSIDTAFGWLKTEGFVFILLITGCYAGILGSNILLKEENDQTIEYLNGLPVSRTEILLKKYLAGLIYVLSLIGITIIFNYACLLLSGDFNQKQYFLLSLTPIFSSIVIYSLCFFLATFTHKTKKMLGISLGIVFVSYVFQIFSSISESTEFLKYFSIFTLSDIRYVIENISINYINILLSIILSIILLSASLVRYKHKELI